MAWSGSVAITPGAGANVQIDQVAGVDMQVVKLDFGAPGTSSPAQIDGSGYLYVNVGAVKAGVTFAVTNAVAANLKVDASGATVPISAAAAIPVSAPNSAPVAVRIASGTSSWVDTLPVSGTVTVNQGTAAAVASAWPILISDGTHTVPVDTGNGNALKVSVVATVGAGAAADEAAFTAGTTEVGVTAGVYNDAIATPASGQLAAARITQYRGVHVNLRTNAGVEIGTSGSPLFIQPTGSGTQPANLSQVGGAAVATVGTGVQQVALTDSAGGLITPANPVPTTPVPNAKGTFWRQHIAFTASTGATAVHTPAGGKTVYVQGIVITPTGSGNLTIFDNADSATTELYNGTLPASGVFKIDFVPPVPLAAGGNLLKYLTGVGASGDFVAWGYDE